MDPIRSSYEDDPDMLEIVREFADELPERREAMQASLASGDLEGLCTLAHQLKGAGGGYGFPQITEAAAELEALLKSGGDAEAAKPRLDALCDVLGAVSVPEGS